MRIGIIADDLTGAADAAVQFVRAGWKTYLQLRPEPSSAPVVAVSTDSRGLSARDAGDAVATAVKRHRAAGITHIYKKVDSTLRGQISSEVHAALESWSPQAIAIVCPAFPAAGRTVVDGELRINGVPVSKTAIGDDPVTPVTESHIPTLLGASHVEATRADSARDLADLIRKNLITTSGRIVVVDAATEDHLQVLAEAVALIGPDAIAVGSAGLARHLAIVWATRLTPRPLPLIPYMPLAASRPLPLTSVNAPVLVIVTSRHDVARRQAAAVAHARAHHHQPTAADLIGDHAWARWSENIIHGVNKKKSTLLLTSPPERGGHELAQLIPRRFAQIAARLVEQDQICGLVVTGGDAARALVDALDATAMDLRGEVIDGVPLGMLVGGPANGLPIVTKAGGFGDDDTLVQSVEAVRYARYEAQV